jgi:molybdopterin synthase catalytic subunit
MRRAEEPMAEPERSDPERADPEVLALVLDEPIDRAAIEAFVQSAQDGALVTFEGVIRDHDHGASVTRLDYQAHPEAERFLRETCLEVARETGLRVAAAHRVGTLAIGDVALVASVAAPHRAEAFAACALLVDRIKERTPIWKRQHLEGGATEWVNL